MRATSGKARMGYPPVGRTLVTALGPVGRGPRSKPRDWLAVGENRQRAAGQVEKRSPFVVDTQMPEHRRPEVVGREGPLLRMFTTGVGRSDHLSGAQAAAGHQNGHRLR